MHKTNHRISLQVFGFMVLLYLLFALLSVGLEPIRKKMQKNIIYAGLGSNTFEQCMESHIDTIKKEVAQSKLESTSKSSESAKNKIYIFGFTLIVVHFLLMYLFSRIIVLFIMKRIDIKPLES